MRKIERLLALPALILALLSFKPAQARAAADDTYCGPGDVAKFGSSDGPAALPSQCVYSAMPQGWQSYKRVCVGPNKTVCVDSQHTPSSYTKVADAINAASCGSIIMIQSQSSNSGQNGQAWYQEHTLSIQTQCNANAWVIVASDRFEDPSFPAEGSRISPAWANPAATSLVGRFSYPVPGTSGVYVPKIMSSAANAAVLSFNGGTYWRFIGLELTGQAGTQQAGLAEVNPHFTGNVAGDHIIFDRDIVHGGDSLNSAVYTGKSLNQNGYPINALGESVTDTEAGIAGREITSLAVVDSYIFDIICVAACIDSHAVALGGNEVGVSEGPTKLVNNYLEASGENFFSGGGGSGADTGCCGIPHDIEIRRNLGYKPYQIWQEQRMSSPNPSYYGTKPIVKNLGEFKDGQRILIEGNVFEYNWGEQSDQWGDVLLLVPRNQGRPYTVCVNTDGSGTLNAVACPGGGTTDFNANVVSQFCAVPNHCRVGLDLRHMRDNHSLTQSWHSPTQITVDPPLPSTTTSVAVCQPGGNPNSPLYDVTVRYNIMRHAARGVAIGTELSTCGDMSLAAARIMMHDNQLDDIDGSWSLKGENGGSAVSLGNVNSVQSNTTNNVTVAHNTLLIRDSLVDGHEEGAINLYNAGQGTQLTNIMLRDNLGGAGLGDHFGPGDVCIGSKQTTPSTTLLNCIAGNSWCVTNNVFSNQTVPGLSSNKPNDPWPSSSPNCGGVGNQSNAEPADYTSFAFANLNQANGGDYHLTGSYKGGGSDGKDIGANIDTVNGCTTGVENGQGGAPCNNGGGGGGPAIAITAPASGATVSGIVTVSGTASDSAGISKIEVSTDGVHFLTASGTTNWSFSLDTTKIANGSLTITARATDTSGSQATTSVSVNISNGGTITITHAAGASPNPVTGTNTTLTVAASDSSYPPSSLIYTWAQSGGALGGPVPVTFNINGSNAAQSSTASFTQAGSYSFYVTVKDPNGAIAQSTVAITVNQTLSALAVTPASATDGVRKTQPFTASGVDQFGAAMALSPSWFVSDGGAIDQSGLFTAGGVPGGPFRITAYSGAVAGAADVVIVDTTAPTVAISSPANGQRVTGIVTITGTASDNGSVAWVQFRVDGSNLGAPVSTPPYTAIWNTGKVTVLVGTHTLTAVAADEAGNQTVSATVSVYVAPTRIALGYVQGGSGPQDAGGAGGGPIGFAQAQFVLEAGDPGIPNQPALTASVAMPSGLKTMTLNQMAPQLYSAIVSSSLFNAQDFAQSGATVSVTINGLSFALALNGDTINPQAGGAILGAGAQAALTVAAQQLTADAQILLVPLEQGGLGSIASLLSKEGFGLLGPVQQLSQTSSATLTSAQMLLSFDPSQIPHGLDPKQVRMGWYNPATGSWQTMNSAAVNGSVMSAPINQFGLYAPLALLPSSTPGPRSCYVYPNPAVGVAPTTRIFTGQVDEVEVTVFDVAGREIRSGSASGAPTGIANGDYYYDIPLDAGMASGGYFFAAHAKSGGQVLKCRGKFAVVR